MMKTDGYSLEVLSAENGSNIPEHTYQAPWGPNGTNTPYWFYQDVEAPPTLKVFLVQGVVP